ncbi:MAG: hypothetical protein IKE43_01420 [Coriobacteriales bacterium]|nr:hypothetical protein [Coriobacteriales bacterium]
MLNPKCKKTIDELLQTTYWIIDILPERVPEDSSGQYFAVEKYFLEKEQLAVIKEKHINVVLKLNCYRRVSIDEGATYNPSPKLVAEEIQKQYLPILLDDAMIISEPDNTSMTLYNPDEKLLELVKTIAAGEGLFVWRPSL